MTVLTRNPAVFAAKAPHLADDCALHFVTGDVRAFVASVWPNERFDFIIHAATEASAKLNDQEPARMLETIVEGTRNALEFAVASGARRFLLTSSGAIYGAQPSALTHVPEDYAGGPDCTETQSAYAEGKWMAELLCACFHRRHGIAPLIARCFAFVGPFLPLDAHFAVGNFIREALAGGPIRVGGDGTPFRSYLYAADLAIWLWTILLKGESMRPYNVGSSRDLTIAQLAGEVKAAVNPDLEIAIAKSAVPGARPSRYVPDNSRAIAELNLHEYIGLTEAIKRTANYHIP